MLRKLNLFVLLAFASTLVIISCGDSETELEMDYRDDWIGSYVGTKSNSSFQDTMFATVITFEVVKDSETSDGLIVNGINFPISEEGTYGPEFLDDGITNYELIITGDELSLQSFGNIPDGIILPCYIIATKQ